MTTKKSLNKVAATALIPALALGIFTAPAMAFGAFTTNVDVDNTNDSYVENTFSVRANTGDNTANGGMGRMGGRSGNSGSNAGDGGEAGDGGDGGDATAGDGAAALAESGYGAQGGNGGMGGNTGDTGNGGNGGNGGMGGSITTGDAFATVLIDSDINDNLTEVTITPESDMYDEAFESADNYYERHLAEWSQESDEWATDGLLTDTSGSSFEEESSSDDLIDDNHWEMYTKTYVPVETNVDVNNDNSDEEYNSGEVEAETGNNTTNGGDGEEGGESGTSGEDAGDGGDGGEGGEGGDADADGWGDAMATAHDGGAGGDGAEGGDTGSTGDAGDAGHGAEGGVIVTGLADSYASVVRVANRNVTRITR
ncbi:MAG: hypothetical protein UU98_C0008G0013 [Parcubacteria group bacterium GW2011_GWD2_42_14]|nr:MAG: hypothetical protein UU98_C0008G0013 [Parcubacteria group bacterium GW2011_GWD2_42_14]